MMTKPRVTRRVIPVHRCAIALLFCLLSLSTRAAVITVGSMTRDTGSQQSWWLIIDTLNNREWVAWDFARYYTYAETVDLIEYGFFQGFTMARNVDAQMFVNALFPVNHCSATSNIDTLCATYTPASLELLTGESEWNYRESYIGDRSDNDYVWFLSDNGVGQELGAIRVHTDDVDPDENVLLKFNEYLSIATAEDLWANCRDTFDFLTSDPDIRVCEVGYLLYRDVATSPVPLPAAFSVFGAGLACVFRMTRARRHAKH